MNSIQIGKIISTNRKLKGITQEELANHLGVSKPAVSKWESGQSYPDILLLPVLASFFNITVDQLIGYEPQMTTADVKKLYHRLSEDFAKKQFDKVYAECEEYIRKYFSCWYLQLQMGLLFINHANLSGSPERGSQIIERALEIFVRIEKSSDDVATAKQALKLEAVCHLALQRPMEAIDILENMNELPMPNEAMLVKAYLMKGDKAKATEYLQGYTYINLMSMLGASTDYFQMYADQPEKMKQYYELFMELSDLFEVDTLHPAVLLQTILMAAMTFAGQGNKEAAMDALEKYVNLLNKNGNVNFYLHGNRIFDALDGYLKAAEIGMDPPRSSKTIWKDLKNAILHNPAFVILEGEDRFKQLKKRIENN